MEIRTALLIELLLFVGIGVYHRIRAEQAKDKLDRTQEGWPILIGLRLSALLLFLSIARWFWDPKALDWASVNRPEWLGWMGVVILGASIVWLTWMYHTLGRNITDTVVTRKSAVFVQHGPYRYVRNPMYTGVLFFGIGLGVAQGNWVIPSGALLVFILLAIRTKTEEKFLIARFGKQYLNYMDRVGRFFPRLSWFI